MDFGLFHSQVLSVLSEQTKVKSASCSPFLAIILGVSVPSCSFLVAPCLGELRDPRSAGCPRGWGPWWQGPSDGPGPPASGPSGECLSPRESGALRCVSPPSPSLPPSCQLGAGGAAHGDRHGQDVRMSSVQNLMDKNPSPNKS